MKKEPPDVIILDMPKYYVVILTTGQWESTWPKNLFITDKEYKAKFYCSKGNAILEKYESYYDAKLESLTLSENLVEDNYSHYSDRNDLAHGSFHYHEIQLRTDIKT